MLMTIESTIMIGKLGTVRMMSVMNIRTVSIFPPATPAKPPTTKAIAMVNTAVANDSMITADAPCTNCDSVSRPGVIRAERVRQEGRLKPLERNAAGYPAQ